VLMPAHVVDKVTPEMKLFRDESFGPVVGIIRARDEAHAIELANDTEYGLSASVFTRDTARGLKVARQIKSGICHVNGPTVHDEAQMPFGGVKASGYGRFGGKAGIDSLHRAALDHHRDPARPLPDLSRVDLSLHQPGINQLVDQRDHVGPLDPEQAANRALVDPRIG
jgi:delta 1-pyrroline-5-carboxylate dehydrogenase